MAKKQSALPGMERESVKDVEVAAEAYVKARDKRIRESENEADTKQVLIDLMKKHGLETYKDEDAGLIITLAHKDNVKVTEVDEQSEEEPSFPRGRSAAAASAPRED